MITENNLLKKNFLMLSPIEAIFEIKFGAGVVVVVDLVFEVTVGGFVVAFCAVALSTKFAINTTKINFNSIAAIFLRAKFIGIFHRFFFVLLEQLEIFSLCT